MAKRIFLTESQLDYIRLFLNENEESEGFSFGTRGRWSDKTFRFTPMKNDTNTDTRIFDNNGNFKVNKIKLPKSGIVSYNLYKINEISISKALKHPEANPSQKYDMASIENFMRRTALYIKHIIGNRPIDIITYPQSSSNFNEKMVSHLMRLMPNTEGIKLIPNLLTKNVKNVYINTDIAKEIGLTDNEIYALQKRIDKWKKDEDLRELRNKLNQLEAEIIEIKKKRGRGRPNSDFVAKTQLLNNYREQIPILRKGLFGRDSTVDKEGNVKDFQIKSIDDRERRSIEGLFQINPQYSGIQQKLRGKNILVFDDNISSGATLDDICLELQKIGVASILPITLAVIPKTIYGAHERLS